MSVYSPKEKLLFVHIPKTAGKSVRVAMGRINKDIYEVTNNKTTDGNYHSTIDVCQKQIPDFNSYYKFTVVRNPWDRVCSWYFFRKEILANSLYKKTTSRIRKFKKVPDIILLNELNLMEKDFNEWLHINVNLPWNNTWFSLAYDQMTWIKDVSIFDKICKFENLKDDMQQIPFFKDKSFDKKTNPSKNDNKVYKELFSTESKDLIANLYKRDIEAFNYEF